MSYEKKIKDLMGRLVSMSPEPPPYPEEAPMARPETRRPSRPALAFAAAAALVAILAIPLLLFTGGEGPILGGTTTTSTSTSSTPSTSTTIPPVTTTAPATTTTVEIFEAWTGTVFLHQPPEDSFSGNPALVAVSVEVVDPTSALASSDPFTEALSLIGPDLPETLFSSIPGDVAVLSTRVEGDTIVADMNESFLAGGQPAGLLSDYTMLNQLVYTLTQERPDMGVLFTVNGDPVEMFGTEGIVLTEPVDRESFVDWLHLIDLTEPIVEIEGEWVIRGIANVFEATLVVNVLDADGNVTHEESVQATCGTGCWGDFEIGLDGDLITPGESSVRLFQYSAENGSIVDAITIPVPEAVVWQFTVGA